MSLVQPIVGHLCSKYAQTAIEGLRKIRDISTAGSDQFLADFIQDPDALNALFEVGNRSGEALTELLDTLTSMLTAAPRPLQPVLVAELCTARRLAVVTKVLAVCREESLQAGIAAMNLCTAMVAVNPRLLLHRLNGVPLSMACFQNQLPYGVRRLHAPRLRFLIACATTKFLQRNAETVSTHGFLTLLVDDAAALLMQGAEAGPELVHRVLDVFLGQFAQSSYISADKKREVLLGQRNIFRILIKALELPDLKIREAIAHAIMAVVKEVVEPSSDYATVHVRDDDRGMTNFVVFLILRLLRPKHNVTETQLVVFILHHAPDLVRPYYSRVARQLLETDNGADGPQSAGAVGGGMRTSTAASIVNLLTRCSLAPIPFHLSSSVATLQTNEVPARTFFALTPKAIGDEICPQGLGEYVHKMINHSTNLLHLAWAIQVTTSTLLRSLQIKRLLIPLQERQRPIRAREDYWDVFDGQLDATLTEALPRREEFWHRVTQQLHHILLAGTGHPQHAKAHFVAQRMFVLMNLYTELFNIRTTWLTAAPAVDPVATAAAALQRGSGRFLASVVSPLPMTMKDFLTVFEDPIASAWQPKTISSLCMLLCANLTRCVALPKLHHISFGTPAKAPRFVTDYPVLLSLLLWFVRHPVETNSADGDVIEARAWITRLTLWCIHGVSIRFAASSEEVYLWLSQLTVATLPTFLHLLNSMLTRSTSKFADQFADELTGPEAAPDDDTNEDVTSKAASSGTLLRAAKHFIAKAKEKYAAATGSAAATAAGGGGGGGPSPKALDVWQKDMQENLPDFERLAAAVEGTTMQARNKLFRREILKAVKSHTSAVQSGKRLVEEVVVLEGSRPSELQLDHDVVIDFFENGIVPSFTLSGDDKAGSSGLPAVLSASTGEELVDQLLPGRRSAGGGGGEAPALAAWTQNPSMLWQVAALLRQWLLEEQENSREQLRHVSIFAIRLFRHLDSAREEWRAADWMSSEGNLQRKGLCGLGLLMLMLTAIQPFIILKARPPVSEVETWPVMSDGLVDRLSEAVCASYTATLGCRDRIKYALLQVLDRLHSSVGTPVVAADPSARLADESQADDRHIVLGRKEKGGSRTVQPGGWGEKVGWASMAFPPRIVTSARYAIGGAVFPVSITGEVAALAQLVQSWSESDAVSEAEKIPLRIRTSFFIRADHSSKACENALAMCFPDAQNSKDRRACDLATICDDTQHDPRYLLPLLFTNAAISRAHPGLVKPHLLRKCFPILLRCLSCLDSVLRQLTSSTLALLPRTCLSSAERSLLNFARLRVIGAIVSKAQAGIAMEADSVIPRLATPLSAFLLTALAALRHPTASLHNHVVNFLLSDDLLKDPMPLHRLLHHFPISCVTNMLMLQHQAELQKGESENVIAAAQSVTKTLKNEAGAHVEIVMRQVALSVATKSDFLTLISHGAITNMAVMASSASSVSSLRLMALRTMTAVSLVCHEVATTAANAAHLSLFCCELAQQVMYTLGNDTSKFQSEQRFFVAIMLLGRKLLRELSSAAESSQLRYHLLRMQRAVAQLQVTSEAVFVSVQKALEVFDVRQQKKKRLRESVLDLSSPFQPDASP
jgi:hypothetical protein